MKKYLYISLIMISILIIVVSVYILFNIYFIVEVKDGQMYDGFGTLYHYQEPHSPYTIIGVGGFMGAGSLLLYCLSRLYERNNNKNSIENNVENTNEMSMKYYDFFYKIYLVALVILNIVTTFINLQYIQDGNTELFITIAINIIMYIVLPIRLKDELSLKNKFGYYLVITFLILDYIYRIIISTINIYLVNPNGNLEMYCVIFFIVYSIWYIPNLLYFIKRKQIFINNK